MQHCWQIIDTISYSYKLVLKVKQQDDASCCWVCYQRFHGILPKNILDHSMRFHGDYKKRWLLIHRVIQILQFTRLNILNKLYLCKRTFFCIYNVYFKWHQQTVMDTSENYRDWMEFRQVLSKFTIFPSLLNRPSSRDFSKMQHRLQYFPRGQWSQRKK